ncbi:MAG: hypothetical protein HYX71_10850 [Opitutae bacterium]|nr:hypothetical protein [Opitutae bacterium]
MSPRPLASAAVVLLLLLNGCRDREIMAYRAPKDPVPPVQPAAPGSGQLPPDHPPLGGGAGVDMANTAVPTGGDSLIWTAPAAWTAMPDRPMRKATFALKGADGTAADLAITAFPGDTGGLLANVNRWRGQIGLPSLAEAEVAAGLDHLDANGLHIDVVDMVGSAGGAPTRLLGAIIPHRGETWFVKLTGPDALVAREKPAFLEFLRTVRPR